MHKVFISEDKDGCKISLKVTARAKRTEISGIGENGEIKLRVAAPPVEGAANKEIQRFFAKLFTSL